MFRYQTQIGKEMFNRYMFILIVFVFTGCSIKTPTNSQSESIRIYDVLNLNKNCRFKAEVIGSEATILSHLFIANEDIVKGARIDIRNKAYAKGANVVILENEPTNYTTSQIYVGQAYFCDN